jgi:transcription elongation factor/antiterminator RfaH
MNSHLESDAAEWYVIHSNPGQEERAARNLEAWNLQTFTPRIRERRCNQYTGEVTYLVKPLFPRYIFARFKASDFLHKVRYTRGVYSIVSFGDTPTAVSEEVISLIESRIDENGYVRLGDEIKPGDEVIVKDGLLKNLIGIFERDLKDADRVMILLNTVSYQVHVSLERAMIKRLG